MNRFQRNVIVAVAIMFVFVVLIQYNSYDGVTQYGNERERYYPTAREYWTGLPISKNNPLYHDPTKNWSKFEAKKEEFKGRFEGNTRSNFTMNGKNEQIHIERLTAIFDEFLGELGWNGIFEALQEFEDEGNIKWPASFAHWLGELLYSRTDTPRHAVEITSRDILHKAPLHASVWSAIEAQGLEDLDAMFSLVFDELCYFRDYPGMGETWISCAHGVGHGLGMLNPDNMADALDICAAVDDGQFQYSCATGIFMNAPVPSKTFAPCDTNRFPAACYRFAEDFFKKYSDHNVTGVCDTQCDPYHKMGCIYGQRYVTKSKDVGKLCTEYWPEVPNQEPESLYHAACVEGFFAIHSLPDKVIDKYCNHIKANHASYTVCERKIEFNRKNITLADEDYYNYDLLETYYNPATAKKCKGAKSILFVSRKDHEN